MSRRKPRLTLQPVLGDRLFILKGVIPSNDSTHYRSDYMIPSLWGLTPPQHSMKYFIYCRKSSEAEDRQILSIESQLTTLRRSFTDRSDIQVIDIYQESYSAKAPGRTLFNEMLSRIEKGEAQGIITWAPDRLARNSIDGGRIVYLIDQGVITDLKFATYTFENNPQGKFMLQIMFGQSKYYSDALSENVKRGNRTKIENGWRPSQAPLGYLNDMVTKTIVKDPVNYPLVRQMFEMMLTGAYTPKTIALIARDQWSFRTPKKKRQGGTPIAMSAVYKILNNPFYAGIIVWNGQSHPGKHEPVITIDEFQRVKNLLHRPGRPKAQKHTFAYTGMIRCGACHQWVTAEHKINRYGYHYVYYHCSKRFLGPRCPELSIELRSLEQQIENFLCSLVVEPEMQSYVVNELAVTAEQSEKDKGAFRTSLEKALEQVAAQLNELTGLRLRNLLTDTEFVAQRQTLQQEHLCLRAKIAEIDSNPVNSIEPFSEVISFSIKATDWFRRADDQSKRLILETVGSNLFLSDKKLNIQAKKPFQQLAQMPQFLRRRAIVDDVRTFLDDPDIKHIVQNIKLLRARVEPQVVPLKGP